MKKIIAAVVGAIVATVAGLYFAGIIHLGGNKPKADTAEAEHKVEAPPVYLSLDPPFVVNFTHRGTLRYLQVSIELMYHDTTQLAKVKEHMPAIRNDLILLFSNQDYEQLSSTAGKESLRHQIFAAINKVIGVGTPAPAAGTAEVVAPSAPAAEAPAAAGGNSALGEVYFTNFVMQ